MKPSLIVTFALALFATTSTTQAQNAAKLKQELRTKEREAAKDPNALYEAGKWAKAQALDADAKRLFEKVLKLDPNHAGANEAIGNEQIDGKWVPAKEAAKLRDQALEAEYGAKGWVKVEGVWVEPDHAADAKRGVFHHDGETVTREEKLALQQGKVRHPVTGELIAADKKEQADNGYFPISDGRWVDQQEADKFHSDISRPWAVRTHYATILSTLPLAKILELKVQADQGHETVAPLFGGRQVAPAKRPVIIVAKTESEFREYGNQLGDGTDAAGSFLVREEAHVKLPYQGEVRAAICDNHKDWGARYVRHAAAIAYANAIAEETGTDLPLWFLHGVGSYTSRFDNDSDAGWFGKQQAARGGVENVKALLAGFAISGEMEPTAISGNIFQAGLLLAYATRGGDAKVTEAMTELTDALSGKTKGSPAKALEKLEKELAKAQDGIAAYMKQLIAKAP